MPRLFIDRIDPDYLDVVRRGLSYVNFGTLVSPSSRVFVKPNLTFPRYRPGVMTNPRCVEATVVALKDYTNNIFLGDSDSGGYNPFPMEAVYRETGIEDFSRSHGVTLVNLTRLPRKAVTVPVGRRRVSLDLPRLLTDETDLLVTVPVPKIHMNTQVSLTFKNQWGCIPDPADRLRLHPNFSAVVLAVNQAVHSKVAIVDGAYGLNVSGPMKGQAIPLGWTMVADDIGAAARACCEVMNIPVDRVRHLRAAERHGLLPAMSTIEMSADLSPFRNEQFYLRRRWTDYPGFFAFNSRALAYLAYFSPLSKVLHRLLYLFREPFYDYRTGQAFDENDTSPPIR